MDHADRLAAIAGLLALTAAAAGLAAPGLYRDAPFWADQARGTDLATLLYAVPLLAVGLVATRRGSVLGRLAVVGVLLYLVYNYAIFSFAVAMNPLTIAYIATFGVAVWATAMALPELNGGLINATLATRLPRRGAGVLLVGVSALFGIMWLGQIATATTTGVLPPDLVLAELPTNPVYALDLGLFLPLCLLSGFAVWRRRTGVLAALAVPLLLWLSLTSAGIVGAFGFQAASGAMVPLSVAALVAGIGAATALVPAIAARRPAHQAPSRAPAAGSQAVPTVLS